MGNAELPGQLSPVTALPIAAVLPDLLAALRAGPGAVLEAPPGAGKTTVVPLALLDQPWLGTNRILLLEPRRLAARAAARRMASLVGQEVGRLIGYRTRLDSRVSPETRVEVVTEGILTRMIQDDPGLNGVGAVLFDEFHERTLQADLGLALCLEVRAQWRPELRLLIMSATLDGAPIAALLDGAPVIVSQGRSFPVDIRWLAHAPPARFEDGIESLIVRALTESKDGDILAFLPGQAEIRRVLQRLEARNLGVAVMPLYGDLDQADQDAALQPRSGGQRKVILATAIAETSLTIDGVQVVVDGGLMRKPRFDPNGGMTRLVTLPVSKASATQRSGRAGRQAAGICYRLWTEATHRTLPAFTTAEIVDADLAPLALELARWGVRDPGDLAWLDRPPAAPFAHAQGLLQALGALDEEGRITAHGRAMADLPLHPRLAHMVIAGGAAGLGSLACLLAALLSERDILRGEPDPDLRPRVEAAAGTPPPRADRTAIQRVRQQAEQIARRLTVTRRPISRITIDSDDTGRLLAHAYPDRLAVRRDDGTLQYRLSNGRGAFLREPGLLSGSEALVVAALDGQRRNSRIFLAAPITRIVIEQVFADRIRETDSVAWDSREQVVAARRQRTLGALVLDDVRLETPPPDAIIAAMLGGIGEIGLDCLPWTDTARQLQARLGFLRRVDGDRWPDLSDRALAADLAGWLVPWLTGISRRSHLERLDLAHILSSTLSWEQKQALERLAPTHLVVPSGSRIAINYGDGDVPVLAVRLQEMFGLADTPTIADGKVKLRLHLLSPARRPVQVTQDLASFWATTYRAVKADLKGLYPKHAWPDDPRFAEPTARAKPRR